MQAEQVCVKREVACDAIAFLDHDPLEYWYQGLTDGKKEKKKRMQPV